MVDLVLYHGTDLGSAQKIEKEGFRFFHNPNHWLGNGIYFYFDRDLAKWWTTHPTKQFGHEIETPTIITCKARYEENRICDIRKLADYYWLVERFQYYVENIFSQFYPVDSIGKKETGCLFFDWLFSSRERDVVIGNFYLPDQPYLPNISSSKFKELSLEYTEVQVCVSDRVKESLSKNFEYSVVQ